jgi:hypothetical protein
MIEVPSITLWRPVGTQELELIVATGMRAFPPRLPEQPIFYPVLTEAYATKIARDWNAPRGGGYVTRFQVRADFLSSLRDQRGRRERASGILDSSQRPVCLQCRPHW